MKYKNITLIGTSHIADESIKEVSDAISSGKPDIVALELDRKRLGALFHKSRTGPRISDIRRIGVKGFLFALIGGWAQKKLGKVVNVEPGAEMLAAVRIARKEKIRIALIDQDIEITLMKLSRAITWREKCRFLVDIFNAIFFRKRELKKLGVKELDLRKVPSKSMIAKLIKNLEKRYPNIYRVLVDERNVIMAEKLSKIASMNPGSKIVAVVGAGHEADIIRLLKSPPGNITYELTIG